MSSNQYFFQLLDRQACDEITQIYAKLAEQQAALQELLDRVGINVSCTTEELVVETKIDNIALDCDVSYCYNISFQTQADARVYYCINYGYYSGNNQFEYKSEYLNCFLEDSPSFKTDKKVTRFFDYILTDEEQQEFGDEAVNHFVVRHNGKLMRLEKEVTHFGTDPYYVKIESNGNIHLAVIKSVFGDEQHCFFMQGKRIKIIQLRGEFLYIRQNKLSTEIVHCSSGKVVQTVKDFRTNKAITGIDFVLVLNKDNDGYILY